MQWLWPIPVSLVAAYLINIPPHEPGMVIHGQLMRHRRQVTLQYYCWQKVGIWHSKSVVSFIWVMALFTGGGELSWWCHNVTFPGHSDAWWPQLPTLSSDVITFPGLWSATHDPVSVKWKLSLMMGTRLWSVMMVIMLITRMIGMHISLGNSKPSPQLSEEGGFNISSAIFYQIQWLVFSWCPFHWC